MSVAIMLCSCGLFYGPFLKNKNWNSFWWKRSGFDLIHFAFVFPPWCLLDKLLSLSTSSDVFESRDKQCVCGERGGGRPSALDGPQLSACACRDPGWGEWFHAATCGSVCEGSPSQESAEGLHVELVFIVLPQSLCELTALLQWPGKSNPWYLLICVCVHICIYLYLYFLLWLQPLSAGTPWGVLLDLLMCSCILISTLVASITSDCQTLIVWFSVFVCLCSLDHFHCGIVSTLAIRLLSSWNVDPTVSCIFYFVSQL